MSFPPEIKPPLSHEEFSRRGGRIGGKIGGKAKGACKRRGDSSYYKALRAKSATAKAAKKNARES